MKSFLALAAERQGVGEPVSVPFLGITRSESRFDTTPCLVCGKPLASSRARQCLHCHADWHDLADLLRPSGRSELPYFERSSRAAESDGEHPAAVGALAPGCALVLALEILFGVACAIGVGPKLALLLISAGAAFPFLVLLLKGVRNRFRARNSQER